MFSSLTLPGKRLWTYISPPFTFFFSLCNALVLVDKLRPAIQRLDVRIAAVLCLEIFAQREQQSHLLVNLGLGGITISSD